MFCVFALAIYPFLSNCFEILYISSHQVLNVFEKSNWKSPTEIDIEEPDLPPLIRAMCKESPKTSKFLYCNFCKV